MKKMNLAAYAMPVSDIRKSTVQWAIPHWVPRGAITLLAGDGGVGKTSLWVKLFADLSNGYQTILEDPLEEVEEESCDWDFERNGMPNRTCMYFSAEDSSSRRLGEMLEKYGATTEKIITIDLEHLGGLRYNSPDLEEIIEEHRPEICVFDPVQAFMPRGASMTSRQQSREALDNLVRLGAQYGTAFLLVCHTNKKKTDDWRQRLSGSADLADIARSVIFTDYTHLASGKGIRFISNEKNSYHAPETTVLYRFEDGVLTYAGISAKRFAEYAHDKPASPGGAAEARQSKKDLCKEAIMEMLSEVMEISSEELNRIMKEQGFSRKAIDTAKPELEREGLIRRYCASANGRPEWRIHLLSQDMCEEGENGENGENGEGSQ